jgi:hypothetical protein
MKKMNLSILAVILLLTSTGCRKASLSNCPDAEGPSCDIIQSRLSQYFLVSENGDTTQKALYTYDDQNRLVYISTSYKYGTECKMKETIAYPSSDMVVIKRENYNYYNDITYRAHIVCSIDANGRIDRITSYMGKDTSSITTRRQYFDAQNQLIASATYSADKASQYQQVILQDSVIYEWEDGNIARSRKYNEASYNEMDYIPGSEGRNYFILSYDYLHVLYNPSVKQAYSKNMVKSTSCEYSYDERGRICCNNYKYNHMKCYYTYKCL